MAVSIPLTQTLPSIRQQVELDGVRYGFRFRFNERAASWFMDVRDSDDNLLVAGIRCPVDTPLIQHLHHIEGLPPGEFVAFDTTQRQVDPALDDFGTRVLLLYYSPKEIAAL